MTTDLFDSISLEKQNIYTFDKKSVMSNNFFESSTAAVGTIYTIIALAIITAILIWG